MNKKLIKRQFLLCIVGLAVTLSSMSCNDSMNQTKQNGSLKSQDKTKPDPLSNTQKKQDIYSKDSALQVLRTERRNERLANAGNDSAIIASMDALSPRPNSSTARFSLDENTGIVKNCPIVKLMEVYEEKDYGKINSANANIDFSSLPANFQQNIKSKIKSLLSEPDLKEEYEEEVKDYDSYISYIYQLDASYLVAIGDAHGGGIKMLLFFDSDNATMIKASRLDAELSLPIFYINKSKSHFGLSSSVSGSIYVFDSSGNLLVKGDFEGLTGDKGTSYGPVVVSDRFEYTMLTNNISYLFKGKKEVLKTAGHSFYIDDADDLLSYVLGRHQWIIQNINTGEVVYQMDNPNLRMLFNNSNQYFIQSIPTNKIFRYEVQ